MKRVIAVVFAIVMICSLAACGENKKGEGNSVVGGDEQISESKPAIFGDSNVLEVIEGDFSYCLHRKSDSEVDVKITGYRGSSSTVNIGLCRYHDWRLRFLLLQFLNLCHNTG